MSKRDPKIALLTSCTVTRNVDPIVRIQDAPVFDTMRELCDWWVAEMGKVDEEQWATPGHIYAGRSFDAVTEMAQVIGRENVYIITGGVGCAPLTQPIVPYDFTSSKKETHNAHQHVKGEVFLPHVWWEMINMGLYDVQHPIKNLAQEYDVVIAALPKIFIKYILSDLTACGQEAQQRKIFIPIPKSMTTSVPAVVRNSLVPYTREYAASTPFTRVDKAQRVVQKFLREGLERGSFIEYATDIEGEVDEPQQRDDVDYDAMFKDHPEILEADNVGVAILRARNCGYKIGGKARFAGAWRGATTTVEAQNNVNKKDVNQAAKALKNIAKNMKPVEMAEDDIILERLGLFVKALDEVDPTLAFTAADVVSWAEQMYPDDPKGMDNPNKLSYLISYNTKYLGLEELSAGSRKAFRRKR